ncbi:M64 family metallopeptidase [Umezawaea endophytica]|uniref:M64 family metallopeptidase n=1 Tax=Umezawaea endophytica TaxID=1654476 RepID=A0A9X3A2F8_9PSEU|nr:M64 family metallopeptidase [Umezawaea endophytica]MCS7480644.1 M64 family metallopeptidase [Umezawaea endophytica]
MTTSDGRVVGTTKIVDAGDPASRWNLVVLGDGYRETELADYATDVKSFTDGLLGSVPFSSLRQAINVFRVDVVSTDSGADDPTTCGGTGAVAATYLDGTFCANGLDRLLVVDDATAMAVATAQVPQWHKIVVSVNSTKRGGSGGEVAVFSQASDSNQVALHELGHSAFGLADEYEYLQGCGLEDDHNRHPPGEPAQPNVTTNADRATLKWRELVASATPLPTTTNPDCTKCDPRTGPPAGVPASAVGAYEGADHFHCGAFRPQFTCRMRFVDQEFCAVCARRIRQVLNPFLPSVVETTGRVTFLRVHDVGTGFGPPSDFLDVEVVVQLDTEPGRAFGFQLREGTTEVVRKGMLDTLRTAFDRNSPVRVDYRRTGIDNGVLVRVADLP